MTKSQYKKLFSQSDWTVEELAAVFDLIEKINDKHFQFDHYPAQFEIVSSEQLLDMYASVGLPINYPHWSFGKDYMVNKNQYVKGAMGLSYEMIPNCNPNISYNLEDNNLCLMTLVYAHANIGHSFFFKNNYLFKQWTQADTIVDYMKFAKNYILKCEEKYGYEEVELFLDACHSIQEYGVDFYKRPKKTLAKETERLQNLIDWEEQNHNILDKLTNKSVPEEVDYSEVLKEPQENILYFLEKNTPNLPVWKQELIRIVRKIAQYLLPQGQTKTSNEGCLVEGSLINTENGLMDIKDIVENKYSGRVWDGSKWNKIYDWFNNKNIKRIKITTSYGHILHGGMDHRIFNNGSWVKLSDLKLGDELILNEDFESLDLNYQNISYTHRASITEKEIEKITGLNRRYYRSVSNNRHKCAEDKKLQYLEFDKLFNEHVQGKPKGAVCKHLTIPSILDEDLAYWLGTYMGDGNLSYKETGTGGQLCMTNSDLDSIDEFARIGKDKFNLTPNVKHYYNKSRVIFHGKPFLKFLMTEFGITSGKSSHLKEIPKSILKSPKSVMAAFIAGLFDTDGCIAKTGLIYTTNSKVMYYQFKTILEYLGIKTSSYKEIPKLNKKTGEYYRPCYKVLVLGREMLNFQCKIPLRVDRRKKALQSKLEKQQWFCKKNRKFTIKEITEDFGDTYDFSVENSHQYYSGAFLNHNCATKIHHMIVNKMYDEGYLPDSFMLEFIKHHTSVIYQPDWSSKYYSGINPYTLGFNILSDVERICTNPTEEDKHWFPNLIGKDWLTEFKYIVENFRDDSFIAQYLSPKVIRDMKLFSYENDAKEDFVVISHIHDEVGYKKIRETLSKEKNRSTYIPNITVIDVDPKTRQLMLQHESQNGQELDADEMNMTINYIETLWKFPVDIKFK